jgi:hypothetical protein
MTRPRQTSKVRRWLVGLSLPIVVAMAGLIPVASVAAAEPTDMVLTWNLNAVNALSNAPAATPPGAGYTPPVASSALAMTQGAVYDAVNAIAGGHAPYLEGLPSAPASASTAAAAATAAHHVLVGLVPSLPANVLTSLDGLYGASLSQITDGQAKTDGIAIGAAAAAAMLAARADDNRWDPYSFTASFEVGRWRPEVSDFASDPFAWVANVQPFTMTSTSQFRTEGPFDLESAEYAAEFNEVKELGAADSATRTAEQTDTARFFSVNPLPFMNNAFREISTAQGLSPAEQARLFAMSSMASADALIGCWDDKDYWSFWRPITAIRAPDDGNPATEAQADWTPFFANPPYPDHPSGFNCFSAAMMYTAQVYFRTDRITFSLTSPAAGLTNPTRTYTRFAAVLKDTIDARIYMGIHFRAPDEQGAWLGKKVAQWVARHYFEPVD